ncbi:insulinase family protein [Patescibacteria group bacterium]|nr:insulinase family protein [Patescibacteria group bacterium]MBU4512009.1 insulinase family protein [Patescibacteria group bacterium]MCG2692849.1 insulinase family protein [Candidatus Parcubacteria bacterium]
MNYKVTKLSNGLRVITASLHETKAVTVLVLVKVGSRYESRKLNGTSHFIEHMMFKGTQRRPTTLDLSQELDSVGAEYNAFTGKDHTGYFVKLQSEKIELAVDVLADMLFCSKFDSEELNRERGTIIEEINMYEDNPLLFAPAFLEETMFGGTSSLGQLIIGPKENIKNISRQTMLKYRNEFYNPRNMVVGVCGQIKEKRILGLIKTCFSDIKALKHKSIKAIEQSSNRTLRHSSRFLTIEQSDNIIATPRVALKRMDTQQVQLCLGFLGYSYTHKNRYALELLNIILGGNMSSRLFIEVRERRGLCYFIRSNNNPYQDTGSFIIQAGLDKARIDEAIKVIVQELKKLVQLGASPEELQKAKDYVKGRVILEFEDSHEIAEFYTSQLLLLNKIESLEKKLKQIESIRLADIKRVAREILNIKKSTLTLIGPFRDRNRFLRLLWE